MATAAPSVIDKTDTNTDTKNSTDAVWACLLWDDPVNTTAMVTFVLIKVLPPYRPGFDQAQAEQLMWEAHTNGKTAVFSGSRSRAETLACVLHGFALNATIERA